MNSRERFEKIKDQYNKSNEIYSRRIKLKNKHILKQRKPL